MSVLDDPNAALPPIAVLVKRLGGTVTIAQHDLDDIAYGRLLERTLDDYSVEFKIDESPPRASSARHPLSSFVRGSDRRGRRYAPCG